MIYVLHNKPYKGDNSINTIQYYDLKDLIIKLLQIRIHILDKSEDEVVAIVKDNKDLEGDIQYLLKYVFNVMNIRFINKNDKIENGVTFAQKLQQRTFGEGKCSNTYYTLYNHLTDINSFTKNNPKVTKILSAITFIDLITLRIPERLISKDIIKEINNKTYLIKDTDYNKWTFNCNKFTRLQLLQIPLEIIKTSCKTILSNQNLDIVIILCELNYHRDNDFHNFFHAVDVLQATSILIQSMDINEVDKFTLLISTLFHDSCHNGNNNAILVKNNAIHHQIGDKSLLENIHYKILHHLFINILNVNLINNLNHRLRHSHLKLNNLNLELSKELILATDMSSHANYLKILEHEVSYLNLLQLIIKAADISNVTRPLLISTQWAYRISKEFQSYGLLDGSVTEKEYKENVDVGSLTVEGSLQLQPNIPKSQIFFIETFAKEFFTALDEKLGPENIIFHELLKNLSDNYTFWKQLP